MVLPFDVDTELRKSVTERDWKTLRAHIEALSATMQSEDDDNHITPEQWLDVVQRDERKLLTVLFEALDAMARPARFWAVAPKDELASMPLEKDEDVLAAVEALVFVLFMFASLAPKVVAEALAAEHPGAELVAVHLLPSTQALYEAHALSQSASSANMMANNSSSSTTAEDNSESKQQQQVEGNNDDDDDEEAAAQREAAADAIQQTVLGRLALLDALMLNAKRGEVLFGKSRYIVLERLMGLLSARSETVFVSATRCIVLLHYHAGGKLMLRKTLDHPRARVLSESIIGLLNRAHRDKAIERPLIAAVKSVFDAGKYEFFYSNDVLVLVDVLVRQLNDLAKGDGAIVEYTACLHAVLSWPDYSKHRFRINEVRETVALLVENTSDENNAELASLLSSIQQQLDAFS
eukprot:TRINITY_DN57445_c1_g1_i1.p1 TRINITY_DN57445_c1_g1~~TRINITY_DN57445_c1_g1_i1.p1  ORF type:complete len:408 (-),score=218.60 TRINITY_DN57445_c1_g1_i1:688-1911(-)